MWGIQDQLDEYRQRRVQLWWDSDDADSHWLLFTLFFGRPRRYEVGPTATNKKRLLHSLTSKFKSADPAVGILQRTTKGGDYRLERRQPSMAAELFVACMDCGIGVHVRKSQEHLRDNAKKCNHRKDPRNCPMLAPALLKARRSMFAQ
jgi:hypothetical protein